LSLQAATEEHFKKVVEHLGAGGVIAYPTETIWGLGARIDLSLGVDEIFKIKARDNLKAVSILVRDISMAKIYSVVDEKMEAAMSILWPGAVTFVLRAQKNVLSSIRGGGEFVGLRSSPHPWIHELFKHLDVPIVSTSVNLSGQPAAVSFSDLIWLPQLCNKEMNIRKI
jgi:L-threonylcarbamoyladenylate synthase